MPERLPKLHTNQNWKNKPSLDTPINQTNLNKLDLSVDNIDNRVCDFSETKADQTDLLLAVKNITFNKNTGVFTVTKFNNVSYNLDTDIEKIAVNFDYDENPLSPHYQCLVLTLSDGTVKYIDMSALVTQYEFTDSAQIHFSVDASGKISATIILGSITEDMIQPNFLADCRTEVSKAEGHANQANAWADGKINGTDIPSTNPAYNNYSKYWAEQAGTSASAAATSAASSASSADAASSSAINAAASESNAATSETNAAASESNAATSESNAQTYANNASGSATAAASSASSAAASASNASSSETNAEASEANAETYAIRAEAAETSVEEHISGLKPTARGRWNSSETYYQLDLVYYNYNTWMARRESTNVPPTEGADWQLYATSPDNVVLDQILLAGETELIFTDDHITDTAMLEMFSDVYNITVRNMVQSGHSVTITFKALDVDAEIKLTVREG